MSLTVSGFLLLLMIPAKLFTGDVMMTGVRPMGDKMGAGLMGGSLLRLCSCVCCSCCGGGDGWIKIMFGDGFCRRLVSGSS